MVTMCLITLTTDFGLEDAYVGIMKGVILGINPAATIVDLCHAIPPQDVRAAAFLLHTAWRYFPPGTIHVVVVDPGVGSQRRAIAVNVGTATFLAPDNGVLSYVLAGMEEQRAQAVHLTNQWYWLSRVSATFHGRDIFAPVAAHLCLGVPLVELGEPLPLGELVTFPLPLPEHPGDGGWVGHVVHIDHFGNLVTDLEPGAIGDAQAVTIEVGGQHIVGLRRTYKEGTPGEPMALIGSSGRLEIAVPGGQAARWLKAQIGDPVRLYRTKPILDTEEQSR
jgi:S-adenosylmethionine hydrolase